MAKGVRGGGWWVCVGDVAVYWRPLVFLLTPVLLLFLPLQLGSQNGMQQEMNCAYVVVLMAVYWMSEVVPIAVTAFMPLFLFPLLGILSAKDTSMQYLKDTNFLFFGGLIMAAAVENSNLHRRIALRVLLLFGSKPRWLLLGFMCVTCFLSMWMSNTATTAIMVPIALAVLQEVTRKHPLHHALTHDPKDETLMVVMPDYELELGRQPTPDTENQTTKKSRRRKVKFRSIESQTDMVHQAHREKKEIEMEDLTKKEERMCKGVLLSICYAANIGGTGTLTGTGPNLVLRGVLETLFENEDTGITFASWMPFAIPAMLLCLLAGWVWLQLAFFGVKDTVNCCKKASPETKERESVVNSLLKAQYTALGPIRFAEISVLVWFALLVALWIFRDPKFIVGWSSLFTQGYMTDAASAMMIGFVLFAWPEELPDFFFLKSRDKSKKATSRSSLMTWSIMQHRFPWGVIMLLGGGFALAKGVNTSGLSKAIGDGLGWSLQNLPPSAIGAIFIILVTFFTEVSSNTATASIFIPILVSLAENMCVNPLYFVLPVTIACSFAYMIPVATPPNAIVFEQSRGLVTMLDMMASGLVMNILCICVTLFNINTYAYWLMHLGTYPAWAQTHNNSTCNTTLH